MAKISGQSIITKKLPMKSGQESWFKIILKYFAHIKRTFCDNMAQ